MATEPEGNSDIDNDDELDDELEDDPEVPVSPDHPICPRCGWSNTRLSHTRTVMDNVLEMISLRSFRCRSCNRRFRKFHRPIS